MGEQVTAVAAEYDPTQRVETSHTLVIRAVMSQIECPNQNLRPHHQPASSPNPSGRPTPPPRYPCTPDMFLYPCVAYDLDCQVYPSTIAARPLNFIAIGMSHRPGILLQK